MPSNPRRLRLWSIALCASLAMSLLVAPGSAQFGVRGYAEVVQRTVLAITPAWAHDAAVQLAVGDLEQSFRNEFGNDVEVYSSVSADSPGALLVRVQPASGITDADVADELRSLGAEAYLIKPEGTDERPEVVISANSPLGAAYGLFRYLEMARLDPAARLRPPQTLTAPAMGLRLLGDPLDPLYPDPATALRLGFNAIMVDPWPALALYEGYDPSIYDGARYPRERAWVQERRARTAERIAQAKALHLTVVSSGDVPSLPRAAIQQFGEGVGPGQPCIDRPVTAALVAESLREVISAFPQIDVYMTRTGENYELGPLVGVPPGDDKCGPGASVERTVALVHQIVVDQYQRTYIHRAWDLGSNGFHGAPQRAAALAHSYSRDRFMLSFKHTQTDFWRFNPLNPNLLDGSGGMVEFQAAREYEGKGAYPNFLGDVFASGGPEIGDPGGMRLLVDSGVRAIWVWGKGGGWGGPVPHSSLWNDANIYALARLAWDPTLAPEQLAHDFATLQFGAAAAPAMTHILMQSADANLLAFYVGPAARKRGPWAPNNLWVRDDVIRGGEAIAELYRLSRQPDDFDRALAEKRMASRIADGMVEEFESVASLIPDQALVEEVRSSLLYQRALIHVLSNYLDGAFNYFRWLDSGRTDTAAHDRAIEQFEAWQVAWDDFRYLTETLPSVATPYRNEGMEDTVYVALTELDPQHPLLVAPTPTGSDVQ